MMKEMELSLCKVLSDVSCVINHCLPKELAQQSIPYGACPLDWRTAYQYPRLLPGTPQLKIHQVALRTPVSRNNGDDDLRALHAISDLHIDKVDGGGTFGSCTIHTCHEVDKSLCSTTHKRTKYLLQHRGLVVFPNEKGGRGVWIHSMVPGWNCVIIFRTNKCLHGSVALSEEDIQGFALKHLSMFRVITYPLSKIETLLNRVGTELEKWEELISKSDADTQARLSVN